MINSAYSRISLANCPAVPDYAALHPGYVPAAESLGAMSIPIPSSGPNVRPCGPRSARRRKESALNFDDVVLIETVHFDDGARRIGPPAPTIRLGFCLQRTEAKHVGDVHHQPDSIA